MQQISLLEQKYSPSPIDRLRASKSSLCQTDLSCERRDRSVLLWTLRGRTDPLVPKLEAEGWAVDVVKNIEHLDGSGTSCSYRLALARFEARPLDTKRFSQILLSFNPNTEWIALVPDSFRNQIELIRFIKEHFVDFHTTPVDLNRLLISMGHVHGMAELNYMDLANEAYDPKTFGIIGKSVAVQAMRETLERTASSDAPVLISGESGTGKELAAHRIHESSRRANGPFIAMNCAAISANLIQSELFGHEKGAFTGAHQSKKGKIELAHGGTLFLDEIGDVPLELQVVLLRFLEEGLVERVGGICSIPIDVRILAATHCDLELAVEKNQFRLDLYYRLNVLQIVVPPLRARGSDINLLAKIFFDKFANERNSNVKGFSRSALETMSRYQWPGNVRELINRVRRATVMCQNKWICPHHLGFTETLDNVSTFRLDRARAEVESKTIRHALEFTNKNVSSASNLLGVSRRTLYRLIEKYSISA